MASVAMANGANANLLRKWVVRDGKSGNSAPPNVAPPQEEFIALPLVAGRAPIADIRIELHCGATTVTIEWPAQGAGKCATWQAKAKPVANALHAWSIAHRLKMTDGSAIAKALNYWTASSSIAGRATGWSPGRHATAIATQQS